MGWALPSRHEAFIDENAAKLVHNLAHYSAAGAKEVTDALGDHVPLSLTTDTIFLFLFSLRATIEAQGVQRKFGDRAYRRILSAIDDLYRSAFAEGHAQTGAFSQSLMRDVEVSISKSQDPREWVRIHAVRTLETQDPQHEMFHLCLTKVIANGEPIAAVVERET